MKKKLLAIVCALSMVNSILLQANAEENVTISGTGDTSVAFSLSVDSTFEVSVPKRVVLTNGEENKFPIYVKGDISGVETIELKVDDTLTLEQYGKDSVTVNTSIEKTSFSSSEITGEGVATNLVVENYQFTSGRWVGKCSLNVKLKNHAAELEILPEMYTRLLYLETTGTQYFDTGYAPNGNTKVEMDALMNTDSFTDSTHWAKLFGSYQYNASGNNQNFGIGCYHGGTWISYGRGNLKGESYYISGEQDVFYDGNRHKYILSKEGFYFDDTKYYSVTDNLVSNPYPIYIFAENDEGNVTGKSFGRLYGFTISEGEDIVAKMIPCINNETGEIGLYDFVREIFIKNAGTGDLTYMLP